MFGHIFCPFLYKRFKFTIEYVRSTCGPTNYMRNMQENDTKHISNYMRNVWFHSFSHFLSIFRTKDVQIFYHWICETTYEFHRFNDGFPKKMYKKIKLNTSIIILWSIWVCDFNKYNFKMYNLKTWFSKMQLSFWQNCIFAFKITVSLLKLCVLKKNNPLWVIWKCIAIF